MRNKSLDDYLKEANELVPRLSYEQTMDLITNNDTVIIDVREESEVINYGIIKEAINIPRGLIEFKLSPNSPNNPVQIKENTNILVYCAGGYRSALAGKTLMELGFPHVFNIGGFNEWINSGGEVQPFV